MDEIKKMYIDSRYKSNDSVSNSDFKFELKEALDLPDNTVCYVDDISIPHTWYTIEEFNNTLYIVTTIMPDPGNIPTWYHSLALTIPSGNYSGPSLAAALQAELNIAEPDQFVCVYNQASGSIAIRSDNILLFRILSDYQVHTTTISNFALWKDRIGRDKYIDLYNLNSLNEVIRNEDNNEYHPLTTHGISEHTTGFIDLPTVHNIHIHSNNLGHYNSIGVRGENTIIKKTPVRQVLDI